MTCNACAQRRKIIADAHKREGVVGVVKAVPKIIVHVVGKRPK